MRPSGYSKVTLADLMTSRQRAFLVLDELGGGRRVLADRLGALVEEFRPHIGQLQGRCGVGIDLLHDGIRRAGRRDQGEPGDGNQVGVAGLGGGRHVGRHRAARPVGDAEELGLPGLLEAQRGGDVAEEDVDPARRQVDQGRALALVGHVHQLDVGHGGEHFRRQVRGRTVALAGVGHLAGIGLGVGHQLPGRFGREVLARGDDVGHQRQHGDGHELRRIVGQRLVEVVVDRQRRRRSAEQGVAVGLGAVGDLGADIAAGTWLVVDDHRLVPRGRQLVADDAAERVVRAAGREGHDHPHRLLWIGRLGHSAGAANSSINSTARKSPVMCLC